MMANRKQWLAAAMLLAVALIWGCGFIATEYAIRAAVPTELIMAFRFLLGAMAMGLIGARRIRRTSKRELLHSAVAGALLCGAFFAQTIGQGMTKISNVAFITASNVVMIPFILWIMARVRPSARALVLSVVTMAGICLLSVSFSQTLSLAWGDAVVLLCAILFAAHIAYLGHACKQDDPAVVTFWQLLTAGILSLAALLIRAPEITAPQLRQGLLPMVYLGLFSTAFCYYMQTSAQRYIPPAQAGVILSMEGVFGASVSLLLGLEVFRLNMALGGLLVTASVVLSSSRCKAAG